MAQGTPRIRSLEKENGDVSNDEKLSPLTLWELRRIVEQPESYGEVGLWPCRIAPFDPSAEARPASCKTAFGTVTVHLRGCPICASAAEIECTDEEAVMADEVGFVVSCSQVKAYKCFVRTGAWGSPEAVAAAWNRRAPTAEVEGWRPIETAPKDEGVPFLVLLPKNDVAPFVVLQVSWFEGRMYPDARNACIDWDDGITTATHWRPAFPPPTPKAAPLDEAEEQGKKA
jgi:hypothetical protein